MSASSPSVGALGSLAPSGWGREARAVPPGGPYNNNGCRLVRAPSRPRPYATSQLGLAPATLPCACRTEAPRPSFNPFRHPRVQVSDEAPGASSSAPDPSTPAPAAPAPAPAEGLEFSLPTERGVDAATLAAEGIGHVEASTDDLMAQLAALGGGK